MSQSIPLSQGSLEERFAHILQPIRDLTKNWDINIANYLEEYLEDLEKVEITFDDGLTTMNFSEAALLIQGSAGVYAKKVEYLYSLVFQVLDLVTQNKRQKSKGTGDKGEDEEDGEQQADGEDGEFLVLDDDVVDSNGSYRKEQDTSQNKSVRLVPETPSRFMALQEAEKDDTALYNKKGDVLGNPSDFNIDIGYITSDGSFLLEFGDRALLALQSKHTQILGDLVEEERSGCRGDSMALMDNVEEEYDDVFDGAAPVAADDGDGPLNQSKNPTSGPKSHEEPPTTRRSARNKKVKFAESKPAKKVWDQQVLLDPYEKAKTVEKPFTKKKPYKIPENLVQNATKKRKKKPVKKELKPIHEIVETLFSHRSKFPKNPLKVPEYPELEDAFWKEFKLREEDTKEKLKKLKQQGRIDEDQVQVDDEEAEEIPQGLDDLGNDDAEDLIDDRPGVCLTEDLFTDNRVSSGPRGVPSDTGFNTLSSEDMTMTYEDLVKMHVEKYLTSAAQYAQITELSRRVSEWEEKITPKLEEEQAHPNFDIHKYGTDLIEKMARGQTVAFRDLVTDMAEYEICRYTLSILQLANVYNVELSIVPTESGCIMDCLYVTLLSTKRHFECLEEYRAPSIKET